MTVIQPTTQTTDQTPAVLSQDRPLQAHAAEPVQLLEQRELHETTKEPAGVNASKQVLRVCHVSMTLQTGGLERLLVDFGRLTQRARFQLHFVALGEEGQPAEELRAQGWKVETLAGLSKRQRVQRLAELFRRWHIDLVHSHNTYAHYYATLAAKRAGVQAVVNTQHGRGCGRGLKARLQFFLANRFTAKIVAVSHDAAVLCKRQDPLSARKILTIWNGIDLERFAFRGPQLHHTAVSVARLSPEKDFPTLLRAVPHVLQRVPDFQLRIVGSGPEATTLKKLVRQLNIVQHVQLTGERHDVPELLARAGLFVSSSQSEGISLTLLEAMAVGLPVVTTKVGGNPEIVVDGHTGLLVPAGDSIALAAAVVHLCEHKEQWSRMAQAARERVERHFDIRSTVRKYQQLYEQVWKKVSVRRPG